MPTVGKNFLQPTFLSTFASSTGACLASLRSTAAVEMVEFSFSVPVLTGVVVAVSTFLEAGSLDAAAEMVEFSFSADVWLGTPAAVSLSFATG